MAKKHFRAGERLSPVLHDRAGRQATQIAEQFLHQGAVSQACAS
jgi:hypothetical protein